MSDPAHHSRFDAPLLERHVNNIAGLECGYEGSSSREPARGMDSLGHPADQVRIPQELTAYGTYNFTKIGL